MKPIDMKHMDHIEQIAGQDIEHLRLKEATYRGSWKARGGTGAFMMMARKWDRLDNMMEDTPGYDIFAAVAKDMTGADGTALAEVRDLRRYLLLVEAEMTARQSTIHIDCVKDCIPIGAAVTGTVVHAEPATPLATTAFLSWVNINAETYRSIPTQAQFAYEYRAKDVYTLSDFVDDRAAAAVNMTVVLYRPLTLNQEWWLLDRTQLNPAEQEQRKRYQVELNNHEFQYIMGLARLLYDKVQDGGWRMKPEHVALWGVRS